VGLVPPSLERYCYFHAQTSAILQLFPLPDHSIVSVSANAIRMHSKGGVLRMASRSRRLIDITCAEIIDAKSGLMIVGLGSGAVTPCHLFMYNLALNRVGQTCFFRFTRQTGYPCSTLVCPDHKCIVVGTTAGYLLMFDIVSLAVIAPPRNICAGPILSLTLCNDSVLVTGSAVPFTPPPLSTAILAAAEVLVPKHEGDPSKDNGNGSSGAASDAGSVSSLLADASKSNPRMPKMTHDVATKTMRDADIARKQLNTIFTAGPHGGHGSLAQLRKASNIGVNDPIHGNTGLLLKAHAILSPDVVSHVVSLTTKAVLAPRLPVLPHTLLFGQELENDLLYDTSDEEEYAGEEGVNETETSESQHAPSPGEVKHSPASGDAELSTTDPESNPTSETARLGEDAVKPKPKSTLRVDNVEEFRPSTTLPVSANAAADANPAVEAPVEDYSPMPCIATTTFNEYRTDGMSKTRIVSLAPQGFVHVGNFRPDSQDVSYGCSISAFILRAGLGATATTVATSSSGQLIAVADNTGFVELFGWKSKRGSVQQHTTADSAIAANASSSSSSLLTAHGEFIPSHLQGKVVDSDPTPGTGDESQPSEFVVNFDSRPTPFAAVPRNLLTEAEGGYKAGTAIPQYIMLDPNCPGHRQIADNADATMLGYIPLHAIPMPDPETRDELRQSVLMQGIYAYAPTQPASLIVGPAAQTISWQPPLAPIDASLIPGLRQQGYMRTAPLSKDTKFIRNHLASTAKFTVPVTAATRLRLAKEVTTRSFAELLSSPLRREMTVLPEYARVTVTVPKFGLEALDFSQYNLTPLTGLTNFLPNSYCNALLQAAFYTPVFRQAVMAHTCIRETCVTCELGFLFHLLEGYDGYIVLSENFAANANMQTKSWPPATPNSTADPESQATSVGQTQSKMEKSLVPAPKQPSRMRTVEARNFLRMLKNVVHAQTLGLLDPVEPSAELMLAVKSQDFVRFLLSCLEKEACDFLRSLDEKVRDYETSSSRHAQQSSSSQGSIPSQAAEQHKISLQVTRNNFVSSPSDLFELRWLAHFDCPAGRHQWSKPNSSFSIKLTYPTTKTAIPFTDLLQNSLCESSARRVWCEPCNCFQQLNMKRLLTSLPNILCIACNVDTDAELDLWRVAPPSSRTAGVTPVSLFGNATASNSGSGNTGSESAHPSSEPSGEKRDEKSSEPPLSPMSAEEVYYSQVAAPLNPQAVPPPPYDPMFFPASPFEAVGPAFNNDLETNAWSWLPLAIKVVVTPPCEKPLPTSASSFVAGLASQNQASSGKDAKGHSGRSQPKWNAQESTDASRSSSTEPAATILSKHDPLLAAALAQGCNVKIKRIDSITELNEALVESYSKLKEDFAQARAAASHEEPKSHKYSTAEPIAGSSYWTAVYRLGTVVSHITDPPEKNSPLNSVNGEHLITHAIVSSRDLKLYRSRNVLIGSEENDETGLDPKKIEASRPGWFIFNDFVITKSTAREAVNFAHVWKLPCALQFFRIDSVGAHHNRLLLHRIGRLQVLRRARIHNFLYVEALRLNTRRPQASRYVKSFEPLLPNEQVNRGDRFAIDCEFVATALEERSPDGKITRPARHALARVTVVRGSGPKKGTPLIDYFIRSTESVADYLTRYSGISSGDLDVNTSTHHLTTLKAVYLTLYALVSRGAVFVGHGLQADFRMLNICVPPEQILDTVTLFSQQGRLLSLKFLAAHVLGKQIQQKTHDSLEDSVTALELVDKYEELQAQGRLEATIESLYETGRATNWQV